MDSIIIGGGKIGFNLLKTLKESNHDVILIEKDKYICQRIADQIDAEIICGDGSDPEVLADAGIEKASVIAAVTGSDEENMVICQIAKRNFNINKTIARVNNPKNIDTFKELGINKIVCSTDLIADMIKYEVEKDNFKILQTFERGSMLLTEVVVKNNNPWCNKIIRNLQLPKECVIVSLISNDKVIFPRGDTLISENDKVIIVSNHAILKMLIDQLHLGGY